MSFPNPNPNVRRALKDVLKVNQEIFFFKKGRTYEEAGFGCCPTDYVRGKIFRACIHHVVSSFGIFTL